MGTYAPAANEDVDYYALGYFNGRWTSRVVGHIAVQVQEWLAAHPGFEGQIFADWRDGSDHVECTEVFMLGPLLDEIEAANAQAAA